jgi:DNA ligase 1
MKLPTLYHKGKTGKIVEWKIWTEGDEVHTEWGQIGGAKQHTFYRAEAKNVGKSNEVSPQEQAKKEALAEHKFNLDRKYSLTIEEAEETVFLPMLAHKFDDCKHDLKYPVDVQPKLDGNRALAYWQGKKVVLMSRGGKTWSLPHIENAIAQFLPKKYVLDGEIYKPGLNLQNINKLIKKHRPGPHGTESLKFYMFDCFNPKEKKPWSTRSFELACLYSDIPTAECAEVIRKVNSWPASNEEEVKKLCQDYIEDGYEGAIIRSFDGLYELGHRSRSLLKLKNFQDAEFEIIDTYLGKGQHEGCLGFICKTKEGKPFDCYPRGKLEDKREWGLRRNEFPGQWLTVRFQFYTDEGIPFLPIGIAVRDPKDML